MGSQELIVAMGAVSAVLVFTAMAVMGRSYRKAGPDEALFISGGRTGLRIVRGGGTFVFPVLETASRLSLRVVTLHARTSAFHAGLGAAAPIEVMAQVKVDASSEASLATAGEQFLVGTGIGGDEAISRVVLPNLQGHMRAVLGTTEADQIFADAGLYADKLRKDFEPDLARLGLTLVALTLGSGKDAALLSA